MKYIQYCRLRIHLKREFSHIRPMDGHLGFCKLLKLNAKYIPSGERDHSCQQIHKEVPDFLLNDENFLLNFLLNLFVSFSADKTRS